MKLDNLIGALRSAAAERNQDKAYAAIIKLFEAIQANSLEGAAKREELAKKVDDLIDEDK